MKQSTFNNKYLPYVLLVPTFFILVVFLFYPAVETFRLSLFKIHPWTGAEKFAGLYNFIKIFTNGDYLRSFVLSAYFAIVVIIAGLFFSLLIAILLNQKIKGMRFYRTFLIWPYALSPAIAGALFNFLFNPANGVLCYFTGFRTWLTDEKTAIIVVIIAAVWKNLGYNIIFYLTALRNVPVSALESASIDGAGPVKRFIYITFAYLSPTTFFLFVMNTIYAYFASFGLKVLCYSVLLLGLQSFNLERLEKKFIINNRQEDQL